MFSFPATPPQRSPRFTLDSPFFHIPARVPYESPTPRRDCPYPDLTAHPSFRTLTAADTLLHLAASPAPSTRFNLYPSASTGSHPHSQSTQSTFPPSPGPCTPSRSILPLERTRLDVLGHPLSSPYVFWDSPRHPAFEAVSCSPILHESERKEQERARAEARLPDPKRRKAEDRPPRGTRVRSHRRLLNVAISHADYKLSARYSRTDLDNELTDDTDFMNTDRHINTTDRLTVDPSSSPIASLELMYPSSPPHDHPSSQTSLSPLSELSVDDKASSTLVGNLSTPASDTTTLDSVTRVQLGRGTATNVSIAKSNKPHRSRSDVQPDESVPSAEVVDKAVHLAPFHLSSASEPPRTHSSSAASQSVLLEEHSLVHRLRRRVQLESSAPSRSIGSRLNCADWLGSPPRTRARTRTSAGPSRTAQSATEGPPASSRKRRRRPVTVAHDHSSSDSDDNYELSSENRRKRARLVEVHRQDEDRSSPAASPSRCSTPRIEEAAGECSEDAVPQYAQRILPAHVPRHHAFPCFYSRFPVPAYGVRVPCFEPELSMERALGGAVPNAPRSPLDLYTPRWVRGKGGSKVGLCPICVEPLARGGANRKVWLSTKFSAYNYHMQYAHGISPSGTPFSPPVAFKHAARSTASKHEKSRILQGRCHACGKWVNVEGVKDVEVKVPEIFWWKHAATCHGGSHVAGEAGHYIEDDVWKAAVQHLDC